MNTITLAIIGHLVGDYLLQNDYLALNKKKSREVCAIHCCIWTWSVMLFSGWTSSKWPITAAILFATHFIQDHTEIVARWMDLIGQYKFRTGPCSPWSLIVVDNCWHIVTIWAMWRFVV